MRRRMKSMLAVALSLSLCFSQGTMLFADEVSDNGIREEESDVEISEDAVSLSGPDTEEETDKETETVSENEETVSEEETFEEEAAGETEITWGDYKAIKDDEAKTLTLTAYNGDESSITVPATVTLEGTIYTVVPDKDYDNDCSIWAGDDNLTSISFNEGFKAPESCCFLFKNCKKLESIDLTNKCGSSFF